MSESQAQMERNTGTAHNPAPGASAGRMARIQAARVRRRERLKWWWNTVRTIVNEREK